mmetsp:Transcript_37476/g.94702  ORF Transcript_37476/g.94702 Transcript_37476/m.94702 type:complete len:230 (-) Transcript_37476:622-1311(-)
MPWGFTRFSTHACWVSPSAASAATSSVLGTHTCHLEASQGRGSRRGVASGRLPIRPPQSSKGFHRCCQSCHRGESPAAIAPRYLPAYLPRCTLAHSRVIPWAPGAAVNVPTPPASRTLISWFACAVMQAATQQKVTSATQSTHWTHARSPSQSQHMLRQPRTQAKTCRQLLQRMRRTSSLSRPRPYFSRIIMLFTLAARPGHRQPSRHMQGTGQRLSQQLPGCRQQQPP